MQKTGVDFLGNPVKKAWNTHARIIPPMSKGAWEFIY